MNCQSNASGLELSTLSKYQLNKRKKKKKSAEITYDNLNGFEWQVWGFERPPVFFLSRSAPSFHSIVIVAILVVLYEGRCWIKLNILYRSVITSSSVTYGLHMQQSWMSYMIKFDYRRSTYFNDWLGKYRLCEHLYTWYGIVLYYSKNNRLQRYYINDTSEQNHTRKLSHKLCIGIS